MKRKMGLLAIFLLACNEQQTSEAVVATSSSPMELVRLDEQGSQGTPAAHREETAQLMASLAQTSATALAATRLVAGWTSRYAMTYPGNPTGFTFERKQSEAGVLFQISDLGPATPSLDFLGLHSVAGIPERLVWAESLAALFDNAEAGNIGWIPAWSAQGTAPEIGFDARNSRIPFLISWPDSGEGGIVSTATATQAGPAIGKLICSPVTDTIRDGVRHKDGYLRWENGAPLPVPACRAQRALVILFRGMHWEAWQELVRTDGMDDLFHALLLERGHLSAQRAFVHGPTSAEAGEVEWLTGAIPAHAGWLNGQYHARERVDRIDSLVDGNWKVFGGHVTGLSERIPYADDAAALKAVSANGAPLQAVLLDGPRLAVTNQGDVKAALKKSAQQIANLLTEWRTSGRLDLTVVVLGATHGIAEYKGISEYTPEIPYGWSQDGMVISQ